MLLLQHLQDNLKEYLTPPWPLLVVAFSGGRDSVALLHGLWQLQKQRQMKDWEDEENFALLAAHFNHRLRGEEADGDQNFCRNFCSEIGVEFVTAQAAEWQRVYDLENRARKMRYAWLRQVCQQEKAKGFQPVWLVCAHHQEDQAETVLLHLLRGSGTAGLGAMRRRNGCLLRPLLTVSRGEIEAYLAEHNLSWREDSSNASLDYTRNRLRNQLMPQLKELNPRLSAALAQTAEIAAAESDFLAGCVQERMKRAQISDGAAAYLLADWEGEPLAMQRLLVRALWQAASGARVCALGYEHTEAVLQLPLSKTRHLPGGVAVVKSRGWLRFFRLPPETMQRRIAKSRGQNQKI